MPESSLNRRTWVLAALETYEGRLVRYAARLLGDGESARDVVQHAFLRLCDQSPDELVGREAAWLYTVCRNKALDALRRESGNGAAHSLDREPAFGESVESHEPNPAESAAAGELHAALRRLVGELPDGQREAVELWSQGVAYAEIAEITGLSAGNARVLVHRAIARLRQHPQVRSMLFDEAASNVGVRRLADEPSDSNVQQSDESCCDAKKRSRPV
jgi:RNA polymerase sigma-70 factor (ECF subfamily)